MSLLHLIFITGTALFLVMPSAYAITPLALSVAGIFLAGYAGHASNISDTNLRGSWFLLIGGFALFVVVNLILNFYHGDFDAGAYERLMPFILIPAMAWAIRAGAWTPLPWIFAIGTACVLSGSYAVGELLLTPSTRAIGGTDNPIKFGHSAVALFGLCFIAAFFFPFKSQSRRYWQIGLLVAAAFAATASILSGSKGGWPIIILLPLVALYFKTKRLGPAKRLSVHAAIVMLFVAIYSFAPKSLVSDRITSGLNGATHWLQSDGEITEASVSLRMAFWSLGLQVFQESPFLGSGIEGKKAVWLSLLGEDASGDAVRSSGLTSAHNDLIEAMAQGGLIGATGLALLYLGSLFAFFRLVKHSDREVRCLAGMGLFVTIAYLVFGTTVAALWISIFRVGFVFFTVTLLSLISVRIKTLEAG